MRFNRKYIRVTALFLLLEFSFSLFFPPIAWALTGGPSAPEFSTFTPVATTDMVNLFTGDFNYNLPVIEIPGAEGGGYALSLSYNSGNTSEQEATWVGFGWSLNPGAINRTVRGFPDDANGANIDIYNKTRPLWTVGAGVTTGIEILSNDTPLPGYERSSVAGLSLSQTLRFNNYQGYVRGRGFGLHAKGISLNMNMDNDGITWSGNISPAKLLAKKKEESTSEAESNPTAETDTKQRTKMTFGVGLKPPKDYAKSAVSEYSLSTFSEAIRPTSFTKNNGISYNWSVSGQVNASQAPIGLQRGYQGFFNMQFNQYKNSLATYGYMHSDKAGTKGVMDYYTEKGSAFDKRDYFIGMPFANYDMFNLSGEGLSGGFRAFNSELGHYRPNDDESSLKIRQLGIEFMVGVNIGVGVDLGIGSQKTKIDGWSVVNKGNFGSSGSQIFRFNNDLGGTLSYTDDTNIETGVVDLLVNLPGAKVARAVAPNSDGNANFSIGSENGRSSFTEPQYETNNADNPINGFTVYNEEGLKYAYNNPVYVRNQTNLSVDIDNQDVKEWEYLAFRELKLGTDGNSGYEIADGDLNTQEFSTAVGEIRKKKYANNFLLSSISTPDYVDLTGNGLSQDDFGGWTKFNYRKIYGIGETEWYRHRAPYNGLLYQKNSISDTKDDVGSVITGEKEVQYLGSVETNTHIAYFVTNKTTSAVAVLNGSGDNRLDGRGAIALTSEDQASKKSNSGKPIQGTTKIEFLEIIVLFPKDIQGNPVYD
ncbi:MAG: hypothetical protein L3J29_13195, partial [Cyclobacteriaceae bacterium]|nr:hypothetical protein [Cyclobacteriaceae bacterium]